MAMKFLVLPRIPTEVGNKTAGLPQKSKRANSKNHTTLKDEITCHQFFPHLY